MGERVYSFTKLNSKILKVFEKSRKVSGPQNTEYWNAYVGQLKRAALMWSGGKIMIKICNQFDEEERITNTINAINSGKSVTGRAKT